MRYLSGTDNAEKFRASRKRAKKATEEAKSSLYISDSIPFLPFKLLTWVIILLYKI